MVAACMQATGKGGHQLLLTADPSNLTVIFQPTYTFAAVLDAVATGLPGYARGRRCPPRGAREAGSPHT